MPVYEYRCRTCDATFESLRSHADADTPAPCPSGHRTSTRLLSVIAPAARGPEASGLPLSDGGGGCCGGACGCAH